MVINIKVSLLKDRGIPYLSIFDYERLRNLGLPVSDRDIIVVDSTSKNVITSYPQLEAYIADQINFNYIEYSLLKSLILKEPNSVHGKLFILNMNEESISEKEIIDELGIYFSSIFKGPCDYIYLYTLQAEIKKSASSLLYLKEE